MIAKLRNSKGLFEITLPKDFCEDHELQKGDMVCFKIHRLIKNRGNKEEIEDIVKLLEIE